MERREGWSGGGRGVVAKGWGAGLVVVKGWENGGGVI